MDKVVCMLKINKFMRTRCSYWIHGLRAKEK